MEKINKNVKIEAREDMGRDRVFEQSEVGCHDEPAQNEWEKARWNSNGYNQSGFSKK